MDAFPVFLKLQGRPCLIVGGGEVAAHKAELLLRAGAALTVTAPSLHGTLAAWAEEGRLCHVAECFAPGQLRGQSLVIVATEDIALAHQVSERAREAGIPVNVVDRPELSTFIVGALVDRSPVLVAISTGGAAPVLTREIRLAIERLLPPALGRLARFAARFRSAVKAAIPNVLARRRFWEGFFKGPVAQAVLAGDESGAQATMLALVNRSEGGRGTQGIVHIVGAGFGEVDLLTLRASCRLGEADVIVYDDRVAPMILERARRDAERIKIDERQGEIRTVLAALAHAGKKVVWLVGGDPVLARHGGEEAAALRALGVAVELVPGVPAANDSIARPRADAVNA